MDLTNLTTNRCPQCQEEIKETDRFCPNCGLNLEDDSLEFSAKKRRLWKVIDDGKRAIRVILILSGIGFLAALILAANQSSYYHRHSSMATVALISFIIYLVVFGLLYKLTETRPYESMLISTILMGISLILELISLAILSALISAAFLYYFINGLKAASELRDIESKRGIIR